MSPTLLLQKIRMDLDYAERAAFFDRLPHSAAKQPSPLFGVLEE